MSKSVDILLPVGRLVGGSLYVGKTKSMDGEDLKYKTGNKKGEARTDFYFGFAIPKKGEQHWNQTTWGQVIWDVGQKAFPNGQARALTFAWKVIDGDSDIPNKMGRKPRDHEGYPGHWVLNLSTTMKPKIVDSKGVHELIEESYIKPGYFIQVYISAASNESDQSPGLYLNHKIVSLQAFGPEIVLGIDPKEVGFGQCELPAGASQVPVSALPVAMQVANELPVNFGAPPAQPMPLPYTGILVPGPAVPIPAPAGVVVPPPGAVPVQPIFRMTPLATHSREAYHAAGWADADLLAHGYMER